MQSFRHLNGLLHTHPKYSFTHSFLVKHPCCDQLLISLQVCRKLGIIEVDYFGLQFTGSKGENLWLNLRNRICQQMDNVAPCRLRLRVKFFVEPHLILQEQTRYVYCTNTFSSLPNQLVPSLKKKKKVHRNSFFNEVDFSFLCKVHKEHILGKGHCRWAPWT